LRPKSTGIILKSFLLAVLFSFIGIQAEALDYPHYGINNIGCDSCHFVYGTEPSLLPPWTAHTPQNIDDTQYNTLCWSCHNDIEAPYVKTHSSLQIDNDYGDWTVECRVCHNPHQQKQFRTYGSASYLYSGTSTEVTTTTITEAGAGWAVDEYKGMVVIGNVAREKYNYKILSNTADTLTVEGPIDLTKVRAGDTFAIVYGRLIESVIRLDRIAITPPKSGNRAVRFFRASSTEICQELCVWS
jgi:nitrate/TMAO reductase-like tetraheme cytochrome c subunit